MTQRNVCDATRSGVRGMATTIEAVEVEKQLVVSDLA